jgi:hypothetical protein
MIQKRRKKGMKRGVSIVMTASSIPPRAHIPSQDNIQYITNPELPKLKQSQSAKDSK